MESVRKAIPTTYDTFGYDTFRRQMNETLMELDGVISEIEDSGEARETILKFFDGFDWTEYMIWLRYMAHYRYYRTLGLIPSTVSFQRFFVQNYSERKEAARDIARFIRTLGNKLSKWDEIKTAVFEDVERWLNDALDIETKVAMDLIRVSGMELTFEPHVKEDECLQIMHMFGFGPSFENWTEREWLREVRKNFTVALVSENAILIAAGSGKSIADDSEECVTYKMDALYRMFRKIGRMRGIIE